MSAVNCLMLPLSAESTSGVGGKAPVISGAGGTRGSVKLMRATPKRQRLDSEFKVAFSRARPRAVADLAPKNIVDASLTCGFGMSGPYDH